MLSAQLLLPQVISRGDWPGTGFFSAYQDIRTGADWKIQRPPDTVVVHLGGPISEMETVLDRAYAIHEPPMPGEVWVIPGGMPYHTQARGGRVHYAELHFDWNAAEPILGPMLRRREVKARVGHFDAFLYQATVRLETLCSRRSDLEQMAAQSLGHSMLLHFFSAYCHELQKQPRVAPPSLNAEEITRLEEYVKDQLAEPLRLESLASLVHLTVHELLIAFRACFGTTPTQYIIEQRLRRARWLLLNSSKSVAEIASETGFSSHAHLTTTFRSRLRSTPQEFRNCYRAKRTPAS